MQTLPDEETLYQALINRDTSLEGVFYFGVKTTGIFCRPTCSARKPLKQNVEYFNSISSAMDSGYRPCKVCSPLAKSGEIPDWLNALFNDIHASPQESYKDEDLQARGIDATRVRRWFKKAHGMTFHAYLKALRINRAFEKMKHAQDVTSTAMDSGYESFSGFHSAFRNVTGLSPSQSKDQPLITLSQFATPLGPMYAGASETGLCFLEFVDRKMIDAQIEQLQKQMKARFVTGKSDLLDQVEQQLNQYFDGERSEFDLPLDIHGTDFQQQAWHALLKIPYGETRSYQQQADRIGKPKAVRAIASANAKNHIAIVIPCHRVIAKDGGLAGFGGGIWRKKFLLDLEGAIEVDQPKQEQLL
ncbi:MAG: methylated-DNA--[protein]-cysteine S-methyltransferase [Gammaproteobacteria bacterium]|nr:methylated-DNA--[protein]-cysteine S-methyltransferase [Gammaproteobacteria bacterium]